MQITLNQVEIEQALRNYVAEMVAVKDGMTIAVTIRATRGEEGTTAVIDILPEVVAEVVPPVVEKAVRQPRALRTPAKAAAEVVATPDPVVAAATPAAEAVAEPQAEAPVDPVLPDEEEEEEEETSPAEAIPDPVVEDATPAAKPTSLFAGLKRPNNG